MKAIKVALAKYVDSSKDEFWSEFMPEVLCSLRHTPAAATGMSPFQILYGFCLDIPSLVQYAGPATQEGFVKSIENVPERIMLHFKELH